MRTAIAAAAQSDQLMSMKEYPGIAWWEVVHQCCYGTYDGASISHILLSVFVWVDVQAGKHIHHVGQ